MLMMNMEVKINSMNKNLHPGGKNEMNRQVALAKTAKNLQKKVNSYGKAQSIFN